MLKNSFGGTCCLAAVSVIALFASLSVGLPAAAQQFPTSGLQGLPGNGLLGDDLGGGMNEDNPIALSASYELAEGSRRGRITVVAELIPEWHIYSLTQAKGGPTKTTISLSGPAEVKLEGEFAPNVPPHIVSSEEWPGLKVEEHSGIVRWTAPFTIAEGVELNGLVIDVLVKGLTCRTGGACIPLKDTLQAKFTRTYAEPAPVSEFRNQGSVVLWRGEITPASAAPGQTVALRLTAVPDPGFHVYESTTTDAANSTNFVLTRYAGLIPQPPQTTDKIIVKEGIAAGIETVRYHDGQVTWSIPLQIPADAVAGDYEVAGLVGYQACNDTSCRQPKGVQFSGVVRVGNQITDTASPLQLVAAKYPAVLTAIGESTWLSSAPAAEGGSTTETDTPVNNASEGNNAAQEAVADPTIATDVPANVQPKTAQHPFVVILGMALIGGLILNLMPCVLPVVGLKLMALVDTAGEDHRKILSHNLWYSLGLLSVFWVLAAIAIAFRIYFEKSFSWGQQFTYFEFRLALIVLVFVMALSFLGVWEIPLPGFASGRASQQLQKKEGPAGAFFKGVFTTLLATPCSGPLLGVVFGSTLTLPPVGIFVVFTTVGLGMALPYILIGLVPKLVFWLPKPGAWMETLKQLMAFVLLGTVAFLFAGFSETHKLPVFITLIAAWFACWMIGRVPLWDTLQRRLTAWTVGVTVATLIGYASFNSLGVKHDNLVWIPYSAERLAQLQKEGRTVMLDFTADWCVNCHVNYRIALNTAQTADKLEELDAVAMIADWSDHNDEIGDKLNELQSNSIPVLAIYPGRSPNAPIVLRDIVTQGQVLEALQQAGSSIGDKVASNR